MQLKDIVKTLKDMTVQELQDHLRAVRQRRTTGRPVAKAKEAKAEKKQSRTRMSAVDKMIAGLSPEDQAELMRTLENDSGQG